MNKTLNVLCAIALCLSMCYSNKSDWNYNRNANPSEYMTFSVAIKHSEDTINYAKNLALNLSSPFNTTRYLEIDEIQTLFKNNQYYSIVNHWLESHLLFIVEDYGDSFLCMASVKNINNIFSTSISHYTHINGHRIMRSSIDHIIPNEMIDYIELIDGLSNFPTITTNKQTPKSNNADPNYVANEVVNRMYNISDNNASLVTVGVVEFLGGGYQQIGLNEIESTNGMTPKTIICNYGPNDGGGVEDELDLQMMGMTLNNVTLCYINYQTGWIFTMFSHLANWEYTPDVVSISYGWAEWDQCDISSCTNQTAKTYVQRSNVEAMKLVLRGVSVVVSSGDAGAVGRTNENCELTHPINPVYPGSSPWVTSVGATFVKSSPVSKFDYKTEFCNKYGCASGTETQTVTHDQVGWTSGSGFGIYSEPVSDYQVIVVDEYLNSGVFLPNTSWWNRNGRGYPDIVDNGHNCPVWGGCNQQTFCGVDGTSCSSPLFASKLVLLNQHLLSKGRGKRLGFANPFLYMMANFNPSSFKQPNTITYTYCSEYLCCDKNFGFTGTNTTWNAVSGLGQMNMNETLNYMDTLFF